MKYIPKKAGFKFGCWKVIEYIPSGEKSGRYYPVYLLECELCGSTHTRVSTTLHHGKSVMCSACRRSKEIRKKYKSYMYRFCLQHTLDLKTILRLKCRLNNMKSRCHDTNSLSYPWYGAKNISVCEDWRLSWQSFILYAVTLPGHDDPSLQIDRINNKGDYDYGNIRFTTALINSNNKN